MDIQDIAHNQPILNIGVIGHVAHGKSTLVKSLSGKATQKFKKELEKNITIKLGYSNAKIFKCSFCPRPKCYQSFYSDAPKQVKCKYCNRDMKLYTHISFVDSPGHQLFLSTMLSGIKCIDAALILIAANEQCPQPQTKEHIAAIDMMNINKSIILQNKVDLVTVKDAKENYESIKNFVTGTLAENSPIIPISAQAQINLDVLCEYICTKFPVPVRDLSTPLTMFILRSFDINKPGTTIDDLKGGVVGGIINTGILRLNDIVEIKPGIIKFDESSKKFKTIPVKTKVISLQSEKNNLEQAYPGGLIGVGLSIDPSISIADKLVGQMITSLNNSNYLISNNIVCEYNITKELIGSENNDNSKISSIKNNEKLQLSINSSTIKAIIKDINKNSFIAELEKPICTSIDSKICISRKINNSWRIIGYGKIININ